MKALPLFGPLLAVVATPLCFHSPAPTLGAQDRGQAVRKTDAEPRTALVIGAAADSHFMSATAQDRDRLVAQRKFEEGKTLHAQGTAESLRLAVKKYMAQEIYEFYVDLLMQMRKQEPARGHDAAALQTSERARARSLLESLAEARADIRRGVDPKLLAQERLLQQRLNANAEEALKLSASGADDETRLAARRREMDALTVELQQVQTQIRQISPRYGALTQPQPLTLAEIQRQALDADTLLLEYSLRNGIGQADQGRRVGELDAGLYVRGRGAGGG